MKLLGNCKKGYLFVISAPAGTGKTTLVQMLCAEFPAIIKSVSFTTRPSRPGEIEGKDYYHLTPAEFQKKLKENEFLEHATVFGHSYATSRSFVENHLNQGHHVVLIIDTQGALQLKATTKAIFIFISPPNISELRRRLQGRKTESDQTIEERLSWAEREMALASHYDYQIVNENLQTAYEVLRAIFIAEEHKNSAKE